LAVPGATTAGTSGSRAAAGSAGMSRGAAVGGSSGAEGMPSLGAAGMTPTVAGSSGSAGMTVTSAGAVASPSSAAGASAGEVAAAGAGGAAGATSPPCTKGDVKASEVLFIGESFIAQSGDIPRMTSELARKAGTIGASESYRSFAVSGTQLTTGDIPNQYARAQMAGPVKVVLMDGGGNDLLFGDDRCMGSFDARCKEVVDVVADMFTDFKSGGVTDVVYFFYPDPMGIGASIKDAMDILRPEMKKLCDDATAVRCVWVDQRETWDGNYDQFTSDGIHPTAAGSMASAQQIWDAMVKSCIAQ
jgi:lysophospholipase L1-like esterase